MKRISWIIFFCFVTYAAQANQGGLAMSKSWIPADNCTSIEIKQYDYSASPHAEVGGVRIDDQAVVNNFANRIANLPPEGNMFKSLLSKEKIEMIFTCAATKQTIEIYDGRFKTPSTGFNSSVEAKEQEAEIYQDILSLLAKGK